MMGHSKEKFWVFKYCIVEPPLSRSVGDLILEIVNKTDPWSEREVGPSIHIEWIYPMVFCLASKKSSLDLVTLFFCF